VGKPALAVLKAIGAACDMLKSGWLPSHRHEPLAK